MKGVTEAGCWFWGTITCRECNRALREGAFFVFGFLLIGGLWLNGELSGRQTPVWLFIYGVLTIGFCVGLLIEIAAFYRCQTFRHPPLGGVRPECLRVNATLSERR
jgi:hypothetical protein